MWIERLLDGVLRVLTPLGPRYLSPSFLERVYLLWTFRNFTSLPLVVLNHRQQKLVDRLCSQQELLSLPYGMFEQPLIGTIERLSPMYSHAETQAEGALSSLAASGLLPHSSVRGLPPAFRRTCRGSPEYTSPGRSANESDLNGAGSREMGKAEQGLGAIPIGQAAPNCVNRTCRIEPVH